ncbi:Uncharacterized protein APZ42_010290, partial [Daphnia magna]
DVSSDQRDWDRTLQYVCFAYNTARQESTGYSSFFLLYGREPRLPIDLELDADPNPLLTEEDAAMSYADRLQADLTEPKEIRVIFSNRRSSPDLQAISQSRKSRKTSSPLVGTIQDIDHVTRMKSFHEATLEWESPQTSIPDNTERATEKDKQNDGEQQEEAQDLPDAVHSQPLSEEEVTVPEEINVSPD